MDTEAQRLSWSGYGCSWGQSLAAEAGQDHGTGTQTPPRPTRDMDPLLPQLGVSQIPWASCPMLWNTRILQDCPPRALGGSKEAAGVTSKLTVGVLCASEQCSPVLNHLAYLCAGAVGHPLSGSPEAQDTPFHNAPESVAHPGHCRQQLSGPPETLGDSGPRQSYLMAGSRDATGLRSLPGQEARGRRAE